jgi:hypothetical protein
MTLALNRGPWRMFASKDLTSIGVGFSRFYSLPLDFRARSVVILPWSRDLTPRSMVHPFNHTEPS